MGVDWLKFVMKIRHIDAIRIFKDGFFSTFDYVIYVILYALAFVA